MEDGLKHFDAKVNKARKLSIWYNLMVLYIVNENFDAAKKVVAKIIDSKKFQVRKEVQYTTRLLELLIYFEVGVWGLSEEAITAVRRYLERKEKLSEFKLLVLNFMQQLISVTPDQQGKVFGELFLALRERKGEETQPDSLGLAVVAAWTCSKLEKRTIKECLQNPDL